MFTTLKRGSKEGEKKGSFFPAKRGERGKRRSILPNHGKKMREREVCDLARERKEERTKYLLTPATKVQTSVRKGGGHRVENFAVGIEGKEKRGRHTPLPAP